MLDPSKGIALFTDGSCYHATRVGGWAFVAIDAFGGEVEHSGTEVDTTISRMELMAIANGLEEIYQFLGGCDVLVFSDSEYAVLGAIDKTRKRNKHNDLWDWIDHFEAKHKSVTFEHVRGHQDSHYNNRADRLAGEARKAEESS